jgi:hypothetical protein
VMCEAPTLRSRRLIVTEHGISYQARASWGRSHRSSRRSDDLPRRLGKPVVGPRVTGEPLEPDAATRNAERPKGEERKLASRLPGNSYGRFARCAEGKGPRTRYLASRLSYLVHPFKNKYVETEKDLLPQLANTERSVYNRKSSIAYSCSIIHTLT